MRICSAAYQCIAFAYLRTSPPRLSSPYYSHIPSAVNLPLQSATLYLILPPCFPIPSTLKLTFFYPAGFSPFLPQNLFRGVTPPLGFALAFRPGTPCPDHPKTVNITPHFTVNRPCPCAAYTPQPLKNQCFRSTVPKMLIYGTLTEIYIVYKTEIVYNPFRNGVADGG